jgi:hypothetical protein
LRSLHTQIREAALLAGIDMEEADRAASSFQIDHSVIYQRIQQAYQGQLELMTTQEALQRYRPSTGIYGGCLGAPFRPIVATT